MSDYEIVIHLRPPGDPVKIPLPGLSSEVAENDRETLLYELKEARLAEAPFMAVQTKSGYPAEPLALDPHTVTEVDLIELPAG